MWQLRCNGKGDDSGGATVMAMAVTVSILLTADALTSGATMAKRSGDPLVMLTSATVTVVVTAVAVTAKIVKAAAAVVSTAKGVS